MSSLSVKKSFFQTISFGYIFGDTVTLFSLVVKNIGVKRALESNNCPFHTKWRDHIKQIYGFKMAKI